MKKALFLVLTAASLLFAESYQVNTLSARQLGMAHTGAGITTLGSEAMHFNPGGLGFLDKTLDVSAGVTFIIPNVEFWGIEGKTVNNTLGTPLYVYAASSFTEWLSAGVSFTTPYGNTVDYGKNTELSGLLQDISLAVYAIQPTVAVNLRGFGLPAISFGAGPTINFGSFSQSKRLIQEGQFNAAIGLMRMIESNVPAPLYSALGQYENEINGVVAEYANSSVSATFEGDADVAVGFHLGALYEILPNKLSLGVSYRSEVDMKVAKGKVKGTEKAIDDIAKFNEAKTGIKGVLNSYNVAAFDAYLAPTEFPGSGFEATLPLPSNLNAGISFSPIDNLLLAFDFQWIGWGTYDDLALTFDNDLEVVSIKKYSDTFAYRLGAQYTVLNELDVRCGIYFDESPVEDKYLTPESPSTSKIAGSIGLSYRPIPNLSIDVALLRSVSIDGRDATSGDNKDKDDGINGRYEVEAWAPSIGLSFNF